MSTTPVSPPAKPEGPLPSTLPQPWKLWVLLVWHPALGAAVEPVAVLGIDNTAGTAASCVRWLPLVYEEGDPWRERLAAARLTVEQITYWESAETGTCALAPAPVPEDASDLAHAVELVLDELLAEVVPSLPAREA